MTCRLIRAWSGSDTMFQNRDSMERSIRAWSGSDTILRVAIALAMFTSTTTADTDVAALRAMQERFRTVSADIRPSLVRIDTVGPFAP